MSEVNYYRFVEKFLQDKMNCFDTFQKKGPKYVGYADVVGIRDVGGSYCGDIELIAVEVKPYKSNFAKLLGQALGYSLFAHRCYLAVVLRYTDTYTSEEREMATRLGVGLLEIRGGECSEVLVSTHHEPINSLMWRTLDYVGYDRCNICGTLVKADQGWTMNLKKAGNGKDFYYIKSITNRQVLFTGQTKVSRYVIVCSDCVQKLKLSKGS
jgi:hypothetical protein